MTVADKNIEIAKGAGNDAAVDNAGITIDSTQGDERLGTGKMQQMHGHLQNILMLLLAIDSVLLMIRILILIDQMMMYDRFTTNNSETVSIQK